MSFSTGRKPHMNLGVSRCWIMVWLVQITQTVIETDDFRNSGMGREWTRVGQFKAEKEKVKECCLRHPSSSPLWTTGMQELVSFPMCSYSACAELNTNNPNLTPQSEPSTGCDYLCCMLFSESKKREGFLSVVTSVSYFSNQLRFTLTETARARAQRPTLMAG